MLLPEGAAGPAVVPVDDKLDVEDNAPPCAEAVEEEELGLPVEDDDE